MAHDTRAFPAPAKPLVLPPADQSRPYRIRWRSVVGIVAASAVVAFAVVVALAAAAGDRVPLPPIMTPVVLATVDAVVAVQLVIAGGAEFGRWSARRSS